MAIAGAMLLSGPHALAQDRTVDQDEVWRLDSVRVALRTLSPRLRMTLTQETEDAYVALDCVGRCDETIRPGQYQLDAWPPAGSSTLQVHERLEILKDSELTVEPADGTMRGLGKGLIIGGGILLLMGGYWMSNWWDAERDPEASPVAPLVLVATGTLAVGGGITLVLVNRNRVTLTPVAAPAAKRPHLPSALALGVGRDF
jgi:hypothetical protein